MIKGNTAVVVDFKFGIPHPEYADQVKSYCCLLEAMHFQQVEGYLWYVYTGEIASVYPSVKSNTL